jgi:CTD small phosphatase-like protein 2
MTDHNDVLVKDLSKIGRDLKSLIILDNVPQNFILQAENGIFIKSWLGDDKDEIFKLLMPVFESIAKSKCDDVREIIKELKALLMSN